jgi:hypothetical protein
MMGLRGRTFQCVKRTVQNGGATASAEWFSHVLARTPLHT